MAELKTQKTKASVTAFIDAIADTGRRAECKTLVKIMKQATKASPKMWGPSIIGFGDYHYRYDSGREADWFMCGFSPRKASLSLYLMGGVRPHQALLARLGKHKLAVGCLYIERLDEVDLAVLQKLIEAGVKECAKRRV